MNTKNTIKELIDNLLKEIINHIIYQKKIGVCLDTCHLSDSGYDMAGFDKLIEDKIIELNNSNSWNNQLDYLRESKILETKAYISKIPLKISVISVVFFIPLLLLLILGPVLINYIG